MSLTTHPVKFTRQACDRCRKQKLRCIRAENAGACDRCIRKGSQCAYSSSLPKGRRSTHAGSTCIRRDSQPDTSNDLTDGFQDTVSLASGMDWEGIRFNLEGEGNSMTAESPFDWLSSVDSALWDVSGASCSPFQGSPDGIPPKANPTGSGSSPENDCIEGERSDPDILEPLISRLAQLSTQIASLRHSSCVLLKGLATLSPQPNGHSQNRQPPPIDDAVFQSVATWLSRGPGDTTPFSSPLNSHVRETQVSEIQTLGDLLYQTFSTSHHLLELLRLVPNNSVSNTAPVVKPKPTPNFVGFSTPPLDLDRNTPLGPERGQNSTRKSQSSSQTESGNNVVVRHLLMANHTMLLGIYSEVFGLLQHCTSPNASDITAPLREIRLVSVVQLCSYLVDRQHRAVDSYLSSPTSGLLEPEKVSDAMNTEAMKAIRSEVGQRILCLQQMTRI